MLPIDLEGEYGRDGGVARTGHYGNEGEGELAHVASGGRRHTFFVICIGYYLPSDNGLNSANLLEDANRNMCILV